MTLIGKNNIVRISYALDKYITNCQ